MLIGAAADLLRCKKYAAAGFIVLSALFYYAPVELMGIAMFLLLIFSAMRLLIPEKFKRAAADFLSESKRRFLQKKI